MSDSAAASHMANTREGGGGAPTALTGTRHCHGATAALGCGGAKIGAMVIARSASDANDNENVDDNGNDNGTGNAAALATTATSAAWSFSFFPVAPPARAAAIEDSNLGSVSLSAVRQCSTNGPSLASTALPWRSNVKSDDGRAGNTSSMDTSGAECRSNAAFPFLQKPAHIKALAATRKFSPGGCRFFEVVQPHIGSDVEGGAVQVAQDTAFEKTNSDLERITESSDHLFHPITNGVNTDATDATASPYADLPNFRSARVKKNPRKPGAKPSISGGSVVTSLLSSGSVSPPCALVKLAKSSARGRVAISPAPKAKKCLSLKTRVIAPTKISTNALAVTSVIKSRAVALAKAQAVTATPASIQTLTIKPRAVALARVRTAGPVGVDFPRTRADAPKATLVIDHRAVASSEAQAAVSEATSGSRAATSAKTGPTAVAAVHAKVGAGASEKAQTTFPAAIPGPCSAALAKTQATDLARSRAVASAKAGHMALAAVQGEVVGAGTSEKSQTIFQTATPAPRDAASVKDQTISPEITLEIKPRVIALPKAQGATPAPRAITSVKVQPTNSAKKPAVKPRAKVPAKAWPSAPAATGVADRDIGILSCRIPRKQRAGTALGANATSATMVTIGQNDSSAGVAAIPNPISMKHRADSIKASTPTKISGVAATPSGSASIEARVHLAAAKALLQDDRKTGEDDVAMAEGKPCGLATTAEESKISTSAKAAIEVSDCHSITENLSNAPNGQRCLATIRRRRINGEWKVEDAAKRKAVDFKERAIANSASVTPAEGPAEAPVCHVVDSAIENPSTTEEEGLTNNSSAAEAWECPTCAKQFKFRHAQTLKACIHNHMMKHKREPKCRKEEKLGAVAATPLKRAQATYSRSLPIHAGSITVKEKKHGRARGSKGTATRVIARRTPARAAKNKSSRMTFVTPQGTNSEEERSRFVFSTPEASVAVSGAAIAASSTESHAPSSGRWIGPATPGVNLISYSVGRKTSNSKLTFPEIVHALVSDATENMPELVFWNDEGDEFVVKNRGEALKPLIGKYFKHQNYSSLYKQLLNYGWTQKKEKGTFYRDGFARDSRPTELRLITRRGAVRTDKGEKPKSSKRRMAAQLPVLPLVLAEPSACRRRLAPKNKAFADSCGAQTEGRRLKTEAQVSCKPPAARKPLAQPLVQPCFHRSAPKRKALADACSGIQISLNEREKRERADASFNEDKEVDEEEDEEDEEDEEGEWIDSEAGVVQKQRGSDGDETDSLSFGGEVSPFLGKENNRVRNDEVSLDYDNKKHRWTRKRARKKDIFARVTPSRVTATEFIKSETEPYHEVSLDFSELVLGNVQVSGEEYEKFQYSNLFQWSPIKTSSISPAKSSKKRRRISKSIGTPSKMYLRKKDIAGSHDVSNLFPCTGAWSQSVLTTQNTLTNSMRGSQPKTCRAEKRPVFSPITLEASSTSVNFEGLPPEPDTASNWFSWHSRATIASIADLPRIDVDDLLSGDIGEDVVDFFVGPPDVATEFSTPMKGEDIKKHFAPPYSPTTRKCRAGKRRVGMPSISPMSKKRCAAPSSCNTKQMQCFKPVD